jgi:3-mercaptopyruvate sulfurtransferase SseA
MGKAMEPFKESLMNAGLSQDQINAGSMQYLRLQTRIGQSQNKTTTELAEGARKYLIEQDALTKLTGATRKDNEAALEEARSQQRFRAKLDAMRSSGDAGQIAAADELEKTYVLLRSQSKQAAQGFGDLTTGMMNTEAAQKLSMSTNAEAQQVAGKMVAKQLTALSRLQVLLAG